MTTFKSKHIESDRLSQYKLGGSSLGFFCLLRAISQLMQMELDEVDVKKDQISLHNTVETLPFSLRVSSEDAPTPPEPPFHPFFYMISFFCSARCVLTRLQGQPCVNPIESNHFMARYPQQGSVDSPLNDPHEHCRLRTRSILGETFSWQEEAVGRELYRLREDEFCSNDEDYV